MKRSWVPNRSVTAGASIGVPLAIILTWAWNTIAQDNPMPGEVSAALGSVITALISYVIPAKSA